MNNNNNGWVCFHRSILVWEWWDDLPTRNLFFYCLLSANHKDDSWHGIQIPRGSFMTSYDALAKGTGFSIKQMRRAVENLKKTGELGIKRANNITVITINNYGKYQDYGDDEGQTKVKSEGRRRADEGQTKGSERATNNNNNNITNKQYNNNNNIPPFIPPLLEEVSAYCKERGNGIDPEHFIDYYQSKGWMIGKNKMKDWKAAVRNWERDHKQQQSPEIDYSKYIY